MLEKVRRRYILVKIESEKGVNKRDFQNALWSSIIRLFGEYGASQVETTLIEYNEEKGTAILRCSHKALSIVRAAMAAITRINNAEAALHVLLVSGTLRALKKKSEEMFMPRKAKSNMSKQS
ncbi:Rpp14/Pop5 family protein [Candidatus Bathyarchaeota archaeon]|nr:Rpp14/Pop5 family protein [Candidatus Bathyarchaeota archaeon]